MANITGKWSEEGKGIEKWHKIRMIAEGKMSLSRVAVSLYTSIIERMKCVGKSIVRCFNKESKNHLIFGRSPQTLISKVVKMLYLQDTKHI